MREIDAGGPRLVRKCRLICSCDSLYVPQLASAPGVAAYFRGYKGHRFASTKEAVAMSERFRRQVLDFAERKATPIIRFEKGMRKDDVMHKRLRKFKAREGVVFIGIAQEKARVSRTIRKASLKASATGNCGHYLRRCSGWKKATSVRAA